MNLFIDQNSNQNSKEFTFDQDLGRDNTFSFHQSNFLLRRDKKYLNNNQGHYDLYMDGKLIY